MKVLVTGDAGFIGSQVAQKLLKRGDSVVGIDVVNDYYDPELKLARVEHTQRLAAQSSGVYEPNRIDLADKEAVDRLFKGHDFDRVINLAAQAGVRYSLINPYAYTHSNIQGFLNILEGCRHSEVPHLTYASTSSIYGASTRMPFKETDPANHPLTLYAATKLANEMMAHSYSHLYSLPTTGLRFFTVYGPWGRPDMALFVFTKAILEGQPIPLFNGGDHSRDFTYVDDIAEGVVRSSDDVVTENPDWDAASPDPATSSAPYRIFNIGNNQPIALMDYVGAIEKELGKKAKINALPMQAGDIKDTFADSSALMRSVQYQPATPVEVGVSQFVRWYKDYYGV